MKNIVAFSSGGPNNFATVLDFCAAQRGVARVVALVTDRDGIPAIQLAKENSIEAFVVPCEGAYIPSDPASVARRSEFCDRVLTLLKQIEQRQGRISLIVLAFRRVLIGALLAEYRGRIINVHPADLSVEDIHSRTRRYVGLHGLATSVADGNGTTRTSVHWVDGGVDTGDLICLGPTVPVRTDGTRESLGAHEARQKRLSDRPALLAALHQTLLANSRSVLIL